jgi:hypothetical protein
MKEVLEADEVIDGAKSSENAPEGKECFYPDLHLINFEQDSYPTIGKSKEEEDGSGSPRIPNSQWRKWEAKSEDPNGGASQLRHDSNCLDNII